MKLFKLLILFFLSQSFANASVIEHFEKIKKNPSALYAFLLEMPKGGELHYHLSGGAYPEGMIALAAKNDFCFDINTFNIKKNTGTPCQGVAAKDLITNFDLYDKALRAWSFYNFIETSESNHDHFFSAFHKFFPIVEDYESNLLAEVIARAASQHELYMEIQIYTDKGQSMSYVPNSNDSNFSQMEKQLLSNVDYQNNIQSTVTKVDNMLKNARELLGCTQIPNKAACQVEVKFQYYVLREQPLANVFAQALHGFAVASRSKNIVGVNLVQSENGYLSLRDYRQQMQVFNFLHKSYPNVHISLHAGELVNNLATPEDLRFHIHDAIFTGQAQRIGHGADIAYETNSEAIMNYMAKHEIAVEINLISNKVILHLEGAKHPLRYYLEHKVPVTLSTDDEGILRTDLTEQYVKAVLHHGVDYPTLKGINRNALTYSFLPGKSIWLNARKAIPVQECLNFNQQSCLDFVKNNEKARLQRDLEIKLQLFEDKVSKKIEEQGAKEAFPFN